MMNPYVLDKLMDNDKDELLRIFRFLEMMANSEDDDIVNVLGVTVLEELEDDKMPLDQDLYAD